MTLHPAYLWIGSEAELASRCLSFIKRTLCKKKGCGICTDCISIDHNRHYLVRRLSPENYYTLSQLDDVFNTLSFALQPDEHFFFIFEQAQLFNQASANSLLKSLEEPPDGYHFILLAPRTEGILPTIRSRCIVEHVAAGISHQRHPLYYFFTATEERAAEFVKELEKNKIFERDVHELVDQLAQYWHEQLIQGYRTQNDSLIKQCQKKSDILAHARTFPPMAGSAKLFLKNLYVRFLAG